MLGNVLTPFHKLLYIQLIDVKLILLYTILNKSLLVSINKSIFFYCSCGQTYLCTSIFCKVTCILLHVFYILLSAPFRGSRRGGNAEGFNFYLQEDWIDVAEEIDDLFLGDAEVI